MSQMRKLSLLPSSQIPVLLSLICMVFLGLYIDSANISKIPLNDLYTTPTPHLGHQFNTAMKELLPEKERKKTAMCSIVKNEEAYIDEWVDYHHALGFDNFYIYDNTDDFEMEQWGKLKGDHVEVIHYPGEAKQSPAYRDCSKRLTEGDNGNHTWAAFFDADEFLVMKKHEHVSDFLEEHCAHGAIGVNWLEFHSSSWNLYSPAPMTKRFVYRTDFNPHVHIKSIARLDDIRGLNPFEEEQDHHPHSVPLKDGFQTHDTNGRKVRGPSNRKGPIDVAVLHHYVTKSAKEFVLKRSRGRADTKWTDKSIAENIRKATKDYETALAGKDIRPWYSKLRSKKKLTFDDTAWTILKKNVPSYALFDEIGLKQEDPNDIVY